MIPRSMYISSYIRRIQVIHPSHILTHSRYISANTISKDIQQVGKHNFRTPRSYKRVVIVGTVMTIISYSLYIDSEYAVINEMVKRFENPLLNKWDEVDSGTVITRENNNNSDEFIELLPRENIENLLKPLLYNKNNAKMYAAIVGEIGTGKSTAVRKAIRSIQGPKGVIYCLIQAENNYFTELCTALGIRITNNYFQQYVLKFIAPGKGIPIVPTMPTSNDPNILWNRILKPLIETAAIKYKTIYKKQPVLVIDAADKIAKINPTFFRYLQEFAKESVDKGIIRIIFVFSDNANLPILMDPSNSYNSRLGTIIDIGDISDIDAITFLQNQYKIEKSRATEIVNTITGGRFTMLNIYGKRGITEPLDNIRNELNNKTGAIFNDLHLNPSAPIFHKLIEAGTDGLSATIVSKLLNNQMCELLTQCKLLSFHANCTYTVYDRHIEMFIKAKIQAQAKEGK